MFRLFAILAALSVLIGCKKEQPAPPLVAATSESKDAAFWKWAAANLDALKGVKTGREPITEELSKQLEQVEPGLVFELGVGREAFELIISADGKKELFPVVKRLVAAAPALPGSKVIAFRPRKDIDGFTMQLGDRKLGGKDLFFVASNDLDRKGLIAVDLFVQGMKTEDDQPAKNAAFMLLEAAVGEFDLETKIGAIDIKQAPSEIPEELKPLKDLPAALDGWK